MFGELDPRWSIIINLKREMDEGKNFRNEQTCDVSVNAQTMISYINFYIHGRITSS